jgi:hypothetical protein
MYHLNLMFLMFHLFLKNLVPDEPEVPDEPLVPLVPEVPLEPDVPEEPDLYLKNLKFLMNHLFR